MGSDDDGDSQGPSPNLSPSPGEGAAAPEQTIQFSPDDSLDELARRLEQVQARGELVDAGVGEVTQFESQNEPYHRPVLGRVGTALHT